MHAEHFSLRTLLTPIASLTLALLAGCSGGSGGSGLGGGEQAEDPVVVDYPVVYVRRTLNRDEDGVLMGSDIYAPSTFNPGAELVLRDRATATNVALALRRKAAQGAKSRTWRLSYQNM